MEWGFVNASLINLVLNISYTVVSLFVAVVALLIIDKQLLKNVDIQKELQNNNMAVSVFASSIMIFVALIISFGFKA